MWIHERFDTCHITPHTHTDAHTETLNQFATHSGNSRRSAHRLHIHRYRIKMHTHTIKQLQCDWWLCDSHHRASFSGPVRAAIVRGDLRKDEAEYGIECGRKAIDCSPRKESICNRTALLIRAPERPLMTKSREAAHFISAKCILHECLNSAVNTVMVHAQMSDL